MPTEEEYEQTFTNESVYPVNPYSSFGDETSDDESSFLHTPHSSSHELSRTAIFTDDDNSSTSITNIVVKYVETDEAFTVKIGSSDEYTIDQLNEQVHLHFGIPMNMIALLHGGRRLESGRLLSDYPITFSSPNSIVLHLVHLCLPVGGATMVDSDGEEMIMTRPRRVSNDNSTNARATSSRKRKMTEDDVCLDEPIQPRRRKKKKPKKDSDTNARRVPRVSLDDSLLEESEPSKTSSNSSSSSNKSKSKSTKSTSSKSKSSSKPNNKKKKQHATRLLHQSNSKKTEQHTDSKKNKSEQKSKKSKQKSTTSSAEEEDNPSILVPPLAHQPIEEAYINQLLARQRLRICRVKGDGNCNLRVMALALSELRGEEFHHSQLRKDACDYIDDNPQEFAAFTFQNPNGNGEDMPLEEYVQAMRIPGTYSDEYEMIALMKKYKFGIIVYQEVRPDRVNVTSRDLTPEEFKNDPDLPIVSVFLSNRHMGDSAHYDWVVPLDSGAPAVADETDDEFEFFDAFDDEFEFDAFDFKSDAKPKSSKSSFAPKAKAKAKSSNNREVAEALEGTTHFRDVGGNDDGGIDLQEREKFRHYQFNQFRAVQEEYDEHFPNIANETIKKLFIAVKEFMEEMMRRNYTDTNGKPLIYNVFSLPLGLPADAKVVALLFNYLTLEEGLPIIKSGKKNGYMATRSDDTVCCNTIGKLLKVLLVFPRHSITHNSLQQFSSFQKLPVVR